MKKIKLKGLSSDVEVSLIDNMNEILDFINGFTPEEREEFLLQIEKAKQINSYTLSIDPIKRKNGSLYFSALCFNMFADLSADLVLVKAVAEDSEVGLFNILTYGAHLCNLASGKEVQSEL